MTDSLRKRVLLKYANLDADEKRSRWQSDEADRYLIELLGDDLILNTDFMVWFFRNCEDVGVNRRMMFRIKTRLRKKVEDSIREPSSKASSKTGFSKATKEKVLQFWKKYSTVSADRRTGRNEVYLKKSRFVSEYRLNEFDDDKVTAVLKTYRMQQIPYMKAERRVYTGTVLSLAAKFNDLYPSEKVSTNFFYLHKPFYESQHEEKSRSVFVRHALISMRYTKHTA